MLESSVDATLEWLSGFVLRQHPHVERKARQLLLDTLACAVAGVAVPEVAASIERLSREEPGAVRWPGTASGLGTAAAAYAFAMAACWHEACEGLARAHGRPGLHAIPPALSLSLASDAPLGRLLDAIVWGYELGARFGEAMRIRPGMHVDGSWGALGSVAAAMRMRGGDGAAVRSAMALAACQLPASLYLPVSAGCTARNTYAAHAAAMGVFYSATVLAGSTAPAGAFSEAARFLSGAPAGGVRPWAPGGEFLILQGYLKPFAAVRHVHYPVQCALEWRRLGLDPRAIDAITIETYPEALQYCGNRAPVTAIQAQFSLSYGTAYALRHGRLGPEAYGAEVLRDPEQRRLEATVRLIAAPGAGSRGARLRIRTPAGETVCRVDAVPGDPAQPLDAAQVASKALQLMTPVLGGASARRLVDAVLEGSASDALGCA